MRTHHLTTDAAKFELARDPPPALPEPHDPPAIVVQNAPIAHHQAAARQGYDVTEWGYAILERHVLENARNIAP